MVWRCGLVMALVAVTACTSSEEARGAADAGSEGAGRPDTFCFTRPVRPSGRPSPRPGARGSRRRSRRAPNTASSCRCARCSIVANADAFDGREVVTNGTVRANCTKRGCWMEVRPDAARDGAGLTVRFKDYGFFVPLDSRGARVKMQAKVAVTVLTKGQVLELEAEGGTVTGKRPDGSAKVTELTASGVEMRGRKKTSK